MFLHVYFTVIWGKGLPKQATIQFGTRSSTAYE